VDELEPHSDRQARVTRLSLLDRLKRRLGRLASKSEAEIAYWRERAEAEGALDRRDGAAGSMQNSHYEAAFTTGFGLQPVDFAGKRIIDVGCGPRGSLEWASEAAQRVGVDPLVPEYHELGIATHQMSYIHSGAEAIPVPDASFDIVSVLNALDHVDDVDTTIRELTRIAAPGATLLLLVETCHEPTPTEPHYIDWSVVERFGGWAPEWQKRNGIRDDHSLYDTIRDDIPYPGDGPGILRARLRRLADD
jgi:SAM-dependent methyltransferase